MAQQNVHGGEAIRALRSIAGLTLQQVADGASTTVSYLSKVERGLFAPTAEYVGKVAGYISAAIMSASVQNEELGK